MNLKTPALWKEESTLSRLLAPIGWVYYGFSKLHRFVQALGAKPEKLRAPIICIGNITVGGAGKTPTTRMLANMLKISGMEPHCVSRGYGGECHEKPLQVNAEKHTAKQVGDEALLLAKSCTTWVHHDRQKAAKRAADTAASVILVDDGLQNPTFHRDISLLVMDSHYGIGNGQFLPIGPLRESLKAGLKRADSIILIGDGNYKPKTDIPLWKARLLVETDLAPYQEHPILAFAGLARPEKFFETLKAEGLEVIEKIAYPDHHAYEPTELALLQDKAEEQQAILMTTAKDFVKLPASFQEHCVVVDVKLQLEHPKEFQAWLNQKITQSMQRG